MPSNRLWSARTTLVLLLLVVNNLPMVELFVKTVSKGVQSIVYDVSFRTNLLAVQSELGQKVVKPRAFVEGLNEKVGGGPGDPPTPPPKNLPRFLADCVRSKPYMYIIYFAIIRTK